MTATRRRCGRCCKEQLFIPAVVVTAIALSTLPLHFFWVSIRPIYPTFSLLLHHNNHPNLTLLIRNPSPRIHYYFSSVSLQVSSDNGSQPGRKVGPFWQPPGNTKTVAVDGEVGEVKVGAVAEFRVGGVGSVQLNFTAVCDPRVGEQDSEVVQRVVDCDLQVQLVDS